MAEASEAAPSGCQRSRRRDRASSTHQSALWSAEAPQPRLGLGLGFGFGLGLGLGFGYGFGFGFGLG